MTEQRQATPWHPSFWPAAAYSKEGLTEIHMVLWTTEPLLCPTPRALSGLCA